MKFSSRMREIVPAAIAGDHAAPSLSLHVG
jgi:hypothetical protein